MAVTTRWIATPPEAVVAVLEDGWDYCAWVVGTAKIRKVDLGWPAAGSTIHHAVGSWPLLIQDETASVSYVPGKRLVLRARAWPAGEARVDISVEPDHDRGGCVVTIDERASAGPATWIPKQLMDILVDVRNRESLGRLAAIAEGRHRHAHHGADATRDRA